MTFFHTFNSMRLTVLLAIIFPISLFASDPSWMRYPAISPDGSEIAFSFKGDLYKVSSDGGRAMQLTSHAARDYMPVWAPDGTSIVFSSDRFGNFDLFLVSAAGGTPERLTFHSANDEPMAFSPDGQWIYFSSARTDHHRSILYPTGAMPEVYKVRCSGGRPNQVLTTPALNIDLSGDGSRLLFEDKKAFEDQFRKHHTSSHARDIWECVPGEMTFRKLTEFAGEDRDPVYAPDGLSYYFLSERDGNMNLYSATLEAPDQATQLTRFSDFPVRYLSAARDGTLCFSYDGQIYTYRPATGAVRVEVELYADAVNNQTTILPVSGSVTEMVLSPNGKEIFFIFRGEVFVTSVEGSMTRRITNTPEREKDLDVHPEGNAVIYASERNNSWNIYQSKLSGEEEKYFVTSSGFREEPLLETGKETFQPRYSPDGKEVAFLEDRTILKVLNLSSKAERQIHDGSLNWSYADGDQYYRWSPDGKWFLTEFYPREYTFNEVGLISSAGDDSIINLTRSGFSDLRPQWVDKGKMMLWFSDKTGLRSYANSGPSELDVYGMFMTVDAFDEYRLNKEEYELMVGEGEKDKKDSEEEDTASTGKNRDRKKKQVAEEEKDSLEVTPVEIDFDGLTERITKLTIHSSRISDATLTRDGKKLLYFSRMEKGYDLWQTDLRTKETKILAKFGKGAGRLYPDKEGKYLFVLVDGSIQRVEVAKGETKPVAIKGEMVLDGQAERQYLYDHITRQVKEKFYEETLHGTAWDSLSVSYAKYLDHINNDYDYVEMLSELLGELNASHTGARYVNQDPTGDQTAALGAFFDPEFEGPGLRIMEVIENGPLVDGEKKIKPGVIIEKIDGAPIEKEANYYPLLNRKADTWCLLSFYDPVKDERWTKNIKLISIGAESQLLYRRWVKQCRRKVHSLSDGRIGYVHIRGMSDPYYRDLIMEVLGEEVNREALVVDTRFNGGGDLTEDLSNFLDGEIYEQLYIRGKLIGYYTPNRWVHPSMVIANEGNYSDGHCFPAAYRDLELGKVLGMPVAGTCSAVWWEQLQNGVVFGIPVMGVTNKAGEILENNPFEPDIEVRNEYDRIAEGEDQQLIRAVSELMLELDQSGE